jgi:uncharacterized membrane protein
MATERQIAANRRNAVKSIGPRTMQGKRRSRRNAMTHGLTAETVVPVLDDRDQYDALEAALKADYRPRSVIEHQLVARLASLLWRLRRASSIETGLFEIQGKLLRQRRREARSEPTLNHPQLTMFHKYRRPSNAADSVPTINPHFGNPEPRQTDFATAYLRLCYRNGAAMERLSRYETAVWRQVVQTLFLIDATRHRQRLDGSFEPRRFGNS